MPQLDTPSLLTMLSLVIISIMAFESTFNKERKVAIIESGKPKEDEYHRLTLVDSKELMLNGETIKAFRMHSNNQRLVEMLFRQQRVTISDIQKLGIDSSLKQLVCRLKLPSEIIDKHIECSHSELKLINYVK